jgi:hypothetical protein
MKHKSMMNSIIISTVDGDITISDDELSLVSDTDLRLLQISREELLRVFVEGVNLMRAHDVHPRDHVRPVAQENLDGKWEVRLVRYSEFTDPLMFEPSAGNA